MNREVNAGGTFTLVRVLNIYRSQSFGNNAFYAGAGDHPYYIESQPIMENGQPGPAAPLSQEELGGILAGAVRSDSFGSGFLPSEVIAYRPNVTGEASYVIWCKPYVAKLMHEQWERPLLVPFPALLLAVEGDSKLSVFALKGKTRPTPSKALYMAPFWNLSGRWGHSACIGNCTPPASEASLTDKVNAWKAIWFNSTFTHALNVKYGKKSLGELWKGFEGKPFFPAEMLIPTKITLGAFLKQAGF